MLVDRRSSAWFLFIAVLAVIFALQWGPGALSLGKSDAEKPEEFAATVNGKEVPLRDFAIGYQNRMASMRAQGFPMEFAKQFGLHKQVLDGMVANELLCQAAEARGIRVADEEIKERLLKEEQFKTNGQFDFEKYRQVINDYERMNEVAYENKLRRELSAMRLLELVEGGVAVSDEEVRSKYNKEGNTAKATFVKFAVANYASKVPAPKPAELDSWAKNNAAPINAYYEANKTNFFSPEKAKARQILVRVERNAPQSAKDEAKAKADAIHKDLVDNKRNFSEVAKQSSDDTLTKDKGGDLGEIERLSLPSQFADVLFALEAGQVSAVVETPLGFHIGTLESKTPGAQKPIESVQREIATTLLTKERALALAKIDADKALAELKKGKSLLTLYPAAAEEKTEAFAAKPAAQNEKPQAKDTGNFDVLAEFIPQFGPNAALAKEIFARKEAGLVDHLVSSADELAVVEVTERKLPSDADFEKQKAQLKLEATKAKQFETREAFLKTLKGSGKIITNEIAVAKVVGDS